MGTMTYCVNQPDQKNCTGQPDTSWMSSQTCGSGTVVNQYNTVYAKLAVGTPIIWVYPPEQQTIYCKIRIPLNPGEEADSGCPANSPSTAPPLPTCMQFDETKYGAPKPVITSSASGSIITTTVNMLRQYSSNAGPLTVYHSIDSKEVDTNVCRNSDRLVSSVGAPWVKSTSSCTETYTLVQSLVDIVNTAGANNWKAVLENNGQSIKYTLPIYTTFSVSKPADGTCYYVGFVSYVSFRTQLNVASVSPYFVTADTSAKWRFSGLRVTTDNRLEISGSITPLVPGSELRAIALSKRSGPVNIPTNTTTCTTYNVACPQTYSISLASLPNPTDLTDSYDNTMEVWERDASNTFIKTRDVKLSYQLAYTIPSDPTVVDSSVITTESKLYTNNQYRVIRTASYSSLGADNLFIENSITPNSPVIPSNYKLRLDRGYLCCVNYLTAISIYDPVTNPNGGCASSTGKLEWVDLGSETVHPTPSVVLTPSDGLGNKTFRVQVPMNIANAANAAHSTAMTCQVLLISKLEAPAARRGDASNIGATFVATVPFVVDSTGVVTQVSGANAVGISVVTALIVLLYL